MAKKQPRKAALVTKTPVTANYKPFDYGRWFQQPRDLPPFTFATVLAMLMDPTIRLGLAMRCAPLFAAEIAYKEGEDWKPGVKADHPILAKFVERQLAKIWQHLDTIVTAQVWGWAACEVQYKLTQFNTVEIDRLLPRHANDTRARSRDGEVCGVRFLKIEHETQGYVDLDFEPYPKAIFHAHAPDPGCQYGNSILMGACSPWADKWLNGGALDTRRLFMHKDAYGGVDIGYPPGTTNIEGKGEIPNRDIAREMAEQIQAGAVTARPSQYDPVSGKELWPLTRASIPSNPQHILQYPKDLDVEIFRGMEFPDEVFMPSDAGTTGYSGKSIPMQGFYTGLDRWLIRLLMDLVKCVLKPLVALNFGSGRFFEVTAKPLGLQAMEQQGEGKSAQQGNPQPGMPPQFGGQSAGRAQEEGPPRQRMALDPVQAVGEGVLSAAELVKAANEVIVTRLALDKDKHEHKAKGPGGGQFVSKGSNGESSSSATYDALTELAKTDQGAALKQLGEQAKSEGWKRKKVKDYLRAIGIEGDKRDETLESMGFAKVDQEAAATNKEIKTSQLNANRETAEAQERHQSEVEQKRRELEIAKAKEEAERKATIAAEMEEDRDIEPHWPTYRSVLQGFNDWLEYKDASRYRDMGDIMATRSSAQHHEEQIEKNLEHAGTLAKDVWDTVSRTGRATEKQRKLLAVAIAKGVAKHQMKEAAAANA